MRLPEDRAVDEIYASNTTFIVKIVAAVVIAFLLAFLFNFPLGKNIKNYVEGAIAKNRACPLTYDELTVGFFLPKLSFLNLNVPGRCFQKPGQNLKFSEANVRISMPSIWPLGIKLKIEARGDGLRINAFPRLSVTGTDIQIEDSYIQGRFLRSFLPVNLQGDIKIQGNGKLEGKKITQGSLKIESENLYVPAQSIMGFNLIPLPLKAFQLAGTYINKTFNIKALRIGEQMAPLHAEFRGTMKPNNSNLNLSPLSLDGRVKFTDQFLNEISLLRILLNGKPNRESYYYLRLDGTLGAAKPTFVDPP